MSDVLALPPQAIEAERSILGSMMLNPEIIDDISMILDVDDFYQLDHRIVFDACLEISQSGSAVDLITVNDFIVRAGDDDKMGGLSWLGGIIKETPYSGNYKAYCKIVRDRSVLRKLIQSCSEAIGKAYDPQGFSAEEILDSVSQSVGELSVSKSSGNNLEVSRIIVAALDELEEKKKLGDRLIGKTTGLADIDQKIGGLQDGKLIVVAGRPSMGKTTYAMNLVEAVCDDGGVAQVFTLEMPNSEIGAKLLSSQARVNYGKINKPITLDNDDWPRLTSSVSRMLDWKMMVDDSSGVTLEQIKTTCRRTKKEKGLDVVMIDYLQLMDYPKADRVDLSVGMITKQLKGLAKELQVPIILLSQLNRGLESRPNKRPVMSDLRESGAIEQDADIIQFVYRHEMYEPETDQKGVAEIIHAKQRGGQLGTVRLLFRGDLQRFDNFTTQYGSQQ